LKPLVVCQSVTPSFRIYFASWFKVFLYESEYEKKKETLPALVASGEQDFGSDWNGGQ